VAVLVAHPDDETLWAGGTLLMHGGWSAFIGTLCRASDQERATKFSRILDRLGATGAMADVDDGPQQTSLIPDQVRTTLLSLLPDGQFDLVLTHAPRGEYTRHLRHEEVSRAVLRMWACGEIHARELWLFAYTDDEGRRLPRAEDSADILIDLSEEVWAAKHEMLTEIYGFVPNSWEAKAAPRSEAFWKLATPDDALDWLERGSLQR
jgi:LmbE family N-acetylglucosaminyl deacetylase